MRGVKTSRIIHKDFPADTNSLSPSNFHAAVLFSCQIQGVLQQSEHHTGSSEPKVGRKGPGVLAERPDLRICVELQWLTGG